MGVRLPRVRTVQQGSLAEQLSQVGMSEPLARVVSDPLLSSNTVKDIAVPGGGTTVRVPHGLGRVPVGWIVTRARGAQALIFEESSDEFYVVFRSNLAAKLDVRFF